MMNKQSKGTRRLYELDSECYVFDAQVVACEERNGTYAIELDQTAFFPEGGGQYADPGTLGGLTVRDVQMEDDRILHITDAPLAVGSTVQGVLDAEERFVRMQNHSGEHVLCGIAHAKWGAENVGFHLGEREMTMDLDIPLTEEQLAELELAGNRAVWANTPITAGYPDPATLPDLAYRSKLDLTENVRIVQIGEGDKIKDLCACCAPHVANTGEVGLLKLLDFIHYKGGVRIHMLCGPWALADYRRRYTAVATMAAALSVKQEDVLTGFERLRGELEEKKRVISVLRGKLTEATVAAISPTEGNLCLFDEGLEAMEMRHLLNRAVEKCGGFCGVFTGSDEAGYRYVIGRGTPTLDLKRYVKDINAALSARGGGSSEMLQGSCTAPRAVIEAVFADLKVQ